MRILTQTSESTETVTELFSATSNAAGMRGTAHVKIGMLSQILLGGLKAEIWPLLQLKAFFSVIKVNTKFLLY